MSDICLLADEFQTFWNLLNKYQQNSIYFVSALQLAWKTIYKNIKQYITLITDKEMY